MRYLIAALIALALYRRVRRVEVAFDDPYLTEPWGDC